MTFSLSSSYSRAPGKLRPPEGQSTVFSLHQALHPPLLPPSLPRTEVRLLGLCQHSLHHLLGNCYLDREPKCLPPHCLFLGQDHSRRLLHKPSHQRDHKRQPISLRRRHDPPPSNSHGLGPPDQLTPQTSPTRHLPPRHPVRPSPPSTSFPSHIKRAELTPSHSVCVSSAIRIDAVIKYVTTDPTYTQEYAACWTYMEMGCAVISGNLPLLRPYFEACFRIRGITVFTKASSSQPSKSDFSRGAMGNLSHISRTKVGSDDFERISDDLTVGPTGTGSDVELCDRMIVVKTDLTVTTEAVRDVDERKKRAGGW